MSGNLRLKQIFDDLEIARNQVCCLAREIGLNAQAACDCKTLGQAAQLFHFMREVKL